MDSFLKNLPMDRIGEICKKYEVKELSLFGSALRKDFKPESDVDILVEFEPNSGIGLFAFFDLQEELKSLFGKKVDLVPKKGLKELIRDEILSSARLIYAK